MRPSIILFIVVVLAVGCSTRTSAPPKPPATAAAPPDELPVGKDGTVTITGIVLENNNGCAVDLTCFLRLQVGSREVRVTYVTVDGDPIRTKNASAGEQGFAVKIGDHVAVHGHCQNGSTVYIETYSSEDFYIHILPN